MRGFTDQEKQANRIIWRLPEPSIHFRLKSIGKGEPRLTVPVVERYRVLV